MKQPDANQILLEHGVDALRAAIDEAPALTHRPDFAKTVNAPRLFKIERWRDIAFKAEDEWLIKRVLPKRGVAVIYGKSQTFKSFVAFHQGLCIALGIPWAGRRTGKGQVVYIGAEGAGGLRKRKAGYVSSWRDLPIDIDFALLSAAPNLGTDPGDLSVLISTVEAAQMKPAMIVVDTVAKTIGAADENGAGMMAFVVNAEALSNHFDCLVLAVHHVGLGDEAQKRMRGHSSLHAGIDAQLLCERREGENAASLTLQKLKDEECNLKLGVYLSRVVIGHDIDGDEVSTLVVDNVGVTDVQATPTTASANSAVPRSGRLLRDMVVQAIDEDGEPLRPFADGPTVRAVDAEHVRERYYGAIAEKADEDEDQEKLAERQRKAFGRALKSMLDAKNAIAREIDGRRMLWLP